MLGLVRKSTAERLLREVLAERERVVQILNEQLQFCRSQFGAPTETVNRAVSGDTPTPLFEAYTRVDDEQQIEVRAVPSEDEEQLDAMLQAGAITQAEHAQAVEALKRRSPDDIIE